VVALRFRLLKQFRPRLRYIFIGNFQLAQLKDKKLVTGGLVFVQINITNYENWRTLLDATYACLPMPRANVITETRSVFCRENAGFMVAATIIIIITTPIVYGRRQFGVNLPGRY